MYSCIAHNPCANTANRVKKLEGYLTKLGTRTPKRLIVGAAILLLTIVPNAESQIWKTDSTLPSPNDNPWVYPEPEMTHYEEPVYPSISKDAGHQGTVIVNALLDTKGKVLDATTYRSSGYPLLDKAAIEAAFKCEWTPAYRSSQPIAYWTNYPVEFVLEDKKPDTDQESRSFAIMLVKEKDLTSRDAIPEGEIRIWGGFNDGLDSGMIGTISRENNVIGKAPVADLRVIWVDGEEAICHYEMKDSDFFIKPWDRATFIITKPASSAILERGLAAFSEGKPEDALSYLDNIWCLARGNQFVEQVTGQCRQHLKSKTAADLSKSERARWRRQTLDFLKMAKKFNAAGSPHMARRYVNRVLMIDSTNRMALTILDSIPEFDYYDDKTRQCNRFDSILAGTAVPAVDEYVPVDRAVKLVSCEDFDWPMGLGGARSGEVQIRLLIGIDGEVLNAVVHESCGSEKLDNAALEHARDCKYKPAIAHNQPIVSWTGYGLYFLLH
jgi:TonB family protein